MTETAGSALRPAEQPMTVPYDHALLEQCSAAWRSGDWDTLLEVSAEKVEQHPDRGQLAMILAAAHMAGGTAAKARTYLGLARQWGVDERVVARVMVAGVHNTLGRASAAAGGVHRSRAMYHFAEAVAPGAPAGSMWRSTEARARTQLGQLGLGAETQRLFALPNGHAPASAGMPQPFRELQEALRKQEAAMQAGFKKVVDDLFATRSVVRKETANAVRQIEAFFNLKSFMAGEDELPDLHGWPISADFAVHLLRLLVTEDFDSIIEFGSGTSTVLMARTLARMRPSLEGADRPRQYALEHLAEYHAGTAALLERHRLADQVTLLHAPLEPYNVASGETFSYYARAAVARIERPVAPAERQPRVLLMVDGPPASTGPSARYPAIEFVEHLIAGCAVTVILDDHGRTEEKEVGQRWKDSLSQRGIAFRTTELSLEKGALVLRFEMPGQPQLAVA